MKAQAAAIDLVFATIIFLLMAFTLVSFMHSEIKNTEVIFSDDKRDRFTQAAASQLAFSGGRPENWDSSNYERIGLLCGQGELCTRKVTALNSLYSSDYNSTKDKLNLGSYDVSIYICSPTNYSNCDYNITTSERDSNRTASTAVSRAERLSELDGEIVSVIIYSWE